MTDFKSIEMTMKRMIATGYEILLALDEQDFEANPIKELMDKRGRQIQVLHATQIEKKSLTTEQKDSLRNFFTRLYILEKEINKNFSKLSLSYTNRLNDISLQRKVKKSYTNVSKAGSYFDAQISG